MSRRLWVVEGNCPLPKVPAYAMSVDDLLAEIEGSMVAASSTKRLDTSSLPSSRAGSRAVAPSASMRSTAESELDDLLSLTSHSDMPLSAGPSSSVRGGLGSAAPAHSTAVAPQSRSVPSHAAAGSIAGGAAGGSKCSVLALAPDTASFEPGLNKPASSRRFCDQVQCSDCDFGVMRFPGRVW